MMNTISVYTDEAMQSATRNGLPGNLSELWSSIVATARDLFNLPTSAELQNVDWSNITSALTIIGTTLIILLLSGFVLYLLRAIGLYTMAKNEDKSFAWLAFIPFGCLYVTGKIVGKTKLFGIEIDYPEFVLPALFVASMFPVIGFITSIFFILALFGLLYRIYQMKTPNFAVILLVLSIIVPVLAPIFIFAIRNK